MLFCDLDAATVPSHRSATILFSSTCWAIAASKPWSRLIKEYYLPIWQHFLARVGAAAGSGNATDPSTAIRLELTAMGERWTNATNPVVPVGVSGEDPVSVSAELFVKYGTGWVQPSTAPS